MKVVVSLPIHNSIEVAQSQVKNIQYFLPGAVVVLHLSRNFEWGKGVKSLAPLEIDNVLINPERFPTRWGSGLLVDVHNSNFKFAKENLRFDYFVMHSSNDLFVKKGVYDYISAFDAGCAQWDFSSLIQKLKTDSHFSEIEIKNEHPLQKDMALASMMKHLGLSEVLGSQIEGSFYKADIFEQMVGVIEKYYSCLNYDLVYPKEEFYYSTIVSKFAQSIGDVYTFFNWKSVITNEVVDNIRDNNPSCQNDLGVFDFANIYNVKRINRDLGDPVRKYIMSLEK